MRQNKLNYLVLGGLNLLSLALPFMAQATVALHTDSTAKTEQLNAASIKAVESSWLKVPLTCKAREFNASATTLEDKTASQAALEIYKQF